MGDAECVECEEGTYISNNVCAYCREGQYLLVLTLADNTCTGLLHFIKQFFFGFFLVGLEWKHV